MEGNAASKLRGYRVTTWYYSFEALRGTVTVRRVASKLEVDPDSIDVMTGFLGL